MSAEELETATDQPFQQLQRQMNKLVEQMQKGYYNYRSGEVWAPSVNLYETDREYLVCVDLAGVDKEKIDIELMDSRLTIKGSRPVPTFENGSADAAAPPAAAASASPASAKGRSPKESPQPPPPAEGADSRGKYRVHLMEIDHGAFAREVELPLDVRKDEIRATHRNGMLWIELPKKT